MNTLSIPELMTSVTVSVTLTDVWSCSQMVRMRVFLRETVIDWQQFFYRPLQRQQNYERRNFQLPLLHHWWCFGVTELGRGNKFLELAFLQENEKLPHVLVLLPTQYPPSFRLLVYMELPKPRIEAQNKNTQGENGTCSLAVLVKHKFK